MEDHKLPFIDWSLINVTGKNQDCEERSDVSLDLSLSLGNTSASSSTTSTCYHKGEQQIHYKTLETINFFMVKGSGVSLSKPSDTDAEIPLELSPFSCDNVSTHITTTDRKGKQSIICMEKSGSALSDSDTDNDISLALSLSSGHHKGKQAGTMCMKKSGGALSSGPTDDDLSLALSLSLNPRVEVGEGSNHHNLKPKDAFTSKKRKATGSPIPNIKYKRSKVETVRLANDPWCIKKKLFKSDLGDNARLLLASSLVEAHVFRHWNANQLELIETKDGLPVIVWDSDMNTEHEMKFKRWNNGANVLIGNWVTEFVKSRQLKQGDEIGLYWDIHSLRFVFSVLSKGPRQ